MVRLCNVPTCVNCISQSCKPGKIPVRTPTATARQASFEFRARSSEFQVIVEFSVRGPLWLSVCVSVSVSLSPSLSLSLSLFLAQLSLKRLLRGNITWLFWFVRSRSFGVQKSSDATGTAHPCVVRWALHPILRDPVPWTNTSAVWPQLSRSWNVLQPVNC